jgi:hypothetical protein
VLLVELLGLVGAGREPGQGLFGQLQGLLHDLGVVGGEGGFEDR